MRTRKVLQIGLCISVLGGLLTTPTKTSEERITLFYRGPSPKAMLLVEPLYTNQFEVQMVVGNKELEKNDILSCEPYIHREAVTAEGVPVNRMRLKCDGGFELEIYGIVWKR